MKLIPLPSYPRLIILCLILFSTTQLVAQNTVYTTLYSNATFSRSIDQSKPVGSVAGSESVSPTGGANYTIPIALPPGTNGHVPSLSVSYNSHGGNGILGYGWSLSGLSTITRAHDNYFNDENVAPTENTPDDAYSLDGSRLMLTSGTYGAAGSIYKTETENYATIEAQGVNANGPNSFLVTTKEGVLMEYGNSASSQVIHSYGQKVMWRLNKVTDLNGNYYEYIYDNSDDDSRVSEIRYTGNANTGLLPYNSIRFQYSVRQDDNTVYEAGLAYNMKYLLESIIITAQAGLQFKTYDFSYGTDDMYSFLTEVKEIGSDGSELNSTIFKYGEQPADVVENFGSVTSSTTVLSNTAIEPYFGDFDGDGLTDLMSCEFQMINGQRVYDNIFFSKSNGTSTLQHTAGNDIGLNTDMQIVNNEQYGNTYFGFASTDFNGDGRDDVAIRDASVITSTLNSIKIYYSDGLVAPFVDRTYALPVEWNGTYNNIPPNWNYFLQGDFNGDGKSDYVTILGSGSNYFKMYYSDPSSNTINQDIECPNPTTNYLYGANDFATSDRNIAIDFNGDGKTDIMCIKDGVCKIFQVITNPNPANGVFMLDELYSGGYPTKWHTIYFGDFNGDKKTDIITSNASGGDWHVAYSTGKAFEGNSMRDIESDIPTSIQFKRINFGDFNGDGKTDIAYIYTSAAGQKANLYFSTGNNFLYKPFTISTASYNNFETTPCDLNNDGRTDLMWKTAANQYKLLSFGPNGIERLLEKVTDGFNNTSTFEYSPLTANGSFYQKTPAPSIASNLNAVYPMHSVGFPFHCVNSITTPNGIGGTFTNHYKYENAMFHRAGRGFLGFKKFISENSVSNTKTVMEQSINTNYYISLNTKTVSSQLIPSSPLSEVTNNFQVTALPNSRFKTELMGKSEYDALLNATNTTSNTYDNYGNVTQKQTNINGNLESSTSIITYTNVGNTLPFLPSTMTVTKSRIANASVTVTSALNYDTKGNAIQKIDFVGEPKEVQTNYTYNLFGQPLTEIVSAPGLSDRETRYGYDIKGRFKRFTQRVCASCGVNANQTEYFNNHILWGKPSSMQSTDCMVTSYEYDGFGRAIKTTKPNGIDVFTDLSWDISGSQLFKAIKTEANAPINIKYFDKLGREIKTRTESMNSQWVTALKTFNNKGLIASKTNTFINGVETPITTNFLYDGLNRKISESNGLSSMNYSYNYNTASHFKTVTATASGGNFTTSIQDAAGKLVQTEDPGGRVTFFYDSWANKKWVAQNGSTVSWYAYDQYNRKISHQEKNAGLITFDYNAFGDMITQTDASGNTHNFDYDDLGRKIIRTGPEGTTAYTYYCREESIIITHEGEGQPEDDDDPVHSGNRFCCNNNIVRIDGFDNTTEAFEYDNLNQLIAKHQTIAGVTHTTEYSYDQYGNNTNITYPSGVGIDYVYDNKSYMTEVQRAGGPTLYKTNAINGMGRVTDYDLGNGHNSRRTFTNGFPTNFRTPGIQDYSMTWDPQTGNLDSRSDNLAGGGTGVTEQFTYDALNLNRLARWQVAGQTAYDINYDPYPNSGDSKNNIRRKDDAGNYNYTASQVHTMSSINHPSSTTLPPINIPQHTQTLEYTGFQRVDVIAENNAVQEFDYWPSYNRVKSDLYQGGTLQQTRYYLGNYEIQEIIGSATTNKIHYINGPTGLCAIIVESNGVENIYYAYTDHLGSINKVTDAGGTIVAEQSYDPWGRRRNPQNWTYNGITSNSQQWLYRGFTGHEHMPQFGLINMNARLYDPVTGKLISPDNYVANPYSSQAYNRYAYANNNPLVYTDPDGNIAFVPILVGAVIGAYLGGAATNNSFDPTQWDWNSNRTWRGIGGGAVLGAISGASFSFGLAGVGVGTKSGVALKGLTGVLAKTVFVANAVSAWNTTTSLMHDPENALRIFAGKFYIDENPEGGEMQLLQGISRYTWQALQNWVGYNFLQVRNSYDQVDRVEYFGGATFAVAEEQSWGGGVSLGNFITISLFGTFNQENHPDGWMYSSGAVYWHEYGHTFDSRRYGFAYLFGIGIPSARFAANRSNNGWTERLAEEHAVRYAERFGFVIPTF